MPSPLPSQRFPLTQALLDYDRYKTVKLCRYLKHQVQRAQVRLGMADLLEVRS